MQIALSLGINGQGLGHVTTGPVLTPPSIDLLAVDPQTTAGDLPIQLGVSDECHVHYVLTSSANAPSAAQIAAGEDHTGAPAVQSGSVVTYMPESFNATQAASLVSGTYHLHAYPVNADGPGSLTHFGPVTITTPPAS